ncbi:MAG: ORF6N domain-containing protein [Bacteroidetes bacterium]|nr:ORF6N domain-containing protein [Bacteroidota bacterium]
MNDMDVEVVPEETIVSKIYLVRRKKIMLDKDLAELYEVKAFRLREQVKRNIDRFPVNFMFRLTEEEIDLMVSQNAIPSKQHLGGHLPYVFTEHGVLMLANVLRSKRAIKMSIRIIEVFVKVRELLLTHKDILLKLEKIEQQLSGHDEKISLIFEYLKQLEQANQQEPVVKERKRIGFKRNSEV